MRLYTVGSSWFSGEEKKKGAIVPGRLADLAVLSADHFSVPEAEISRIESVLTLVGGKVVYARRREGSARKDAWRRSGGIGCDCFAF